MSQSSNFPVTPNQSSSLFKGIEWQMVSKAAERLGKVSAVSGAGIAERVSALDWLSLRCAAMIALRVRTLACAPKQGTLPHLFDLWTEA